MAAGIKQIRAAYARGVDLDPDFYAFKCGTVKFRLTQQSGGVYMPVTTTGGAADNITPYIFTVGDVPWESGELFDRRGKHYQINTISKTTYAGEVCATQAGITEVQV